MLAEAQPVPGLSRSKLDRPGRRALLALLLSVLLVFGLDSFFPGFIGNLEEQSADAVWRQIARNTREQRLVILDIDEDSLQRHGPWPWPRQRMDELSQRLAAEGAALQIYDIYFPTATPDDSGFATTLARNNAVLAQVFALHGGTVRQGQLTGPLDWAACPSVFPEASHYLANAPAFSALPAGHITPLVGRSGAIRQQPAIICHASQAYPALFLAAARQATHASSLHLTAGSWPLGPAWELQGLPFTAATASTGLALDAQGSVRIPWRVRPESFISLSAADLLAGRVPARLLDNAWVLIGSSALGVNDWIATPFGRPEAGLIVHAQLLIGALEGSIPHTPRAAPLILAFTVLAAAFLMYRLARTRRNPVVWLFAGALGAGLALFLAKALLLDHFALWFDWVPAALTLATYALLLAVFEHTWSRRERDRIYAHLASYLPQPVAAALARRDPSDAIEASRSEIVALYADIRNFSAYNETRPPDETAAVLHTFISRATEIVERHGGLIQAVQGDAILAVWPVRPQESLDQLASQACDAALALLHAAPSILPQCPPPEPGEPPLEPLALGIGLESGPATIGSFGLARRRTYLALGRTVTLAVQLERMTAELAHPLLIGENLAAYLTGRQLKSQGIFLLDGVITPCHIYAYPLQYCAT